MNLFRLVSLAKVVKYTHFEKNWKNTFLVNSKSGKSGKSGLQKETLKKWHLQTDINLSIHGRMQKIRTT